MNARAWFINEDGGVYDYPAHLQERDFPNDDHVAYPDMESARDAVVAGENERQPELDPVFDAAFADHPTDWRTMLIVSYPVDPSWSGTIYRLELTTVKDDGDARVRYLGEIDSRYHELGQIIETLFEEES